MSVVDLPVQGGLPSFTYPKTSMAAWLCENTAQGIVPNNSESQGDLFYQQFTSFSQIFNNQISVNAIVQCPNDPENVNGGYLAGTTNTMGFDAIVKDMTDPIVGCVKHH